MKKNTQRKIEVYAHWTGLSNATLMGLLCATPGRGKEVFSFEYESEWLKNPLAQTLDPSLGHYSGTQYAPSEQANFGIFLDSSPDRWGRVLMKRREEQLAREEKRGIQNLVESDYLLGVYDGNRMGAVRFRTDRNGPFLSEDSAFASPPWTSIRELEQASLALERDHVENDPHYSKWLRMLIAPGASLGGARPKAGVLDEKGHLWIAKFPSAQDAFDIGAWEAVVWQLAQAAGLHTPSAQWRKFSTKHHTFMTKRFDRGPRGSRIHFASAMTLLQRHDGEDSESGVSYLEFIDFLMRSGSRPNEDMEELWRRIVFFICVSNVDDHLRNHGFILEAKGWRLAPAYDMNPVATGNGLKLNISESDHSQDLDLAKSVAESFRLSSKKAENIIKKTVKAVKNWRRIATSLSISVSEQHRMSSAFRVADQTSNQSKLRQ